MSSRGKPYTVWIFSSCLYISGFCVAQEIEELSPIVVLAERRDLSQQPIAEWERDAILQGSPRTIDSLLREDPSFSLFRRQSALFANPTAAGVSLRNTGASAASRSLVLLDGIPQNDPFGAWVNWARYDKYSLSSARIIPAAQSSVWGNLSPAGAVHLTRSDVFLKHHHLSLTGGSHETGGVSTGHHFQSEDETFALGVNANTFHTEGFFGVREDQRGSIDQRLQLDYESAEINGAWKLSDDLRADSTFSYFDERRNNGTALTGNSTEAIDWSLRLTQEDDVFSWQALSYIQLRSFDATFSAAAADRNTEAPSLNQFDVPGLGIGGGLTFDWKPKEEWSLQGGIDTRFVSGETNEDTGFNNGSFARRRLAGGEQSVVGFFSSLKHTLSDDTRIDTSLRLDHWSIHNGTRFERSLRNGAVLLDRAPRSRDDFEPSFALQLEHDLSNSIIFDASIGTSYRLPTLNELHRPFRVRNDITEANSELDPERFYTISAGLTYEDDQWTSSVEFFAHQIDGAIANVPVTDPTEITNIFGTLPVGGSGSQRQNVEEAQVIGLQWKNVLELNDRLSLELGGIWSNTEFTESPRQRLLEDQPFPQTPELRLQTGIDFDLTDTVQFYSNVEYASSVLDDASNAALSDYWTASAGASWQISESVTVRAHVENIFNEEITTGISSDGISSIGQPRAIWFSTEWTF